MRKKTLLIPDRTYTSSADGRLPRNAISVAAAPWDDPNEVVDHTVKMAKPKGGAVGKVFKAKPIKVKPKLPPPVPYKHTYTVDGKTYDY